MTLHPDCAAFLEATAGTPRIREVGAPVNRAYFEELTTLAIEHADPIFSADDIDIPGPGGPITLRVLRPDAEPDRPVLIWFHGGGWATASRRTHDPVLRPLANDVPCVVVIVEYRLAPEHPFPAAYDDCLATLRWVAAHASDIGGDASRVAIGGDSAGGDLAAVVAIAARDEGIGLVLQVLVNPITDDDIDRPSYQEHATGFGLERADMEWYLDAYLPEAWMRQDPRALPMRAEDVGGVAPALVLNAEHDILRDEGEAYAARLVAARVPTVAIRGEGLIHGFFARWATMPAAGPSLTAVIEALRDAFESVSPQKAD